MVTKFFNSIDEVNNYFNIETAASTDEEHLEGHKKKIHEGRKYHYYGTATEKRQTSWKLKKVFQISSAFFLIPLIGFVVLAL